MVSFHPKKESGRRCFDVDIPIGRVYDCYNLSSLDCSAIGCIPSSEPQPVSASRHPNPTDFRRLNGYHFFPYDLFPWFLSFAFRKTPFPHHNWDKTRNREDPQTPFVVRSRRQHRPLPDHIHNRRPCTPISPLLRPLS